MKMSGVSEEELRLAVKQERIPGKSSMVGTFYSVYEQPYDNALGALPSPTVKCPLF